MPHCAPLWNCKRLLMQSVLNSRWTTEVYSINKQQPVSRHFDSNILSKSIMHEQHWTEAAKCILPSFNLTFTLVLFLLWHVKLSSVKRGLLLKHKVKILPQSKYSVFFPSVLRTWTVSRFSWRRCVSLICLATARRREAGSASCVTTLRRPQVRVCVHTHTHTHTHT